MATEIPGAGPAAAQTADAPPDESHGGLRRAIGPKLLLFFVIGDILGTGIYALTGSVAGEVGGAAWTSFGLCFIVAIFTASSYIELVSKYPRAAGAALYTHRAFRMQFLTFLVAFAVMCSGLTSASAAARAFGGNNLRQFINVPTLAAALAFIVVVALINMRGVGESVRANVVLTCVELTGLLIIIAIGALALTRGDADPATALEFTGDGNVFTIVVGGAALAFFALVGFEDSVNMVEETKDPQRNFPRALFTGIAVTGVIYMLVAAIATMVVPLDRLSGSTSPLLEVVEIAAPAFPLKVFAAISLFAVANSALINMLMASRLIYGMSNERIIPSGLGWIHPSRRTPWVAIFFTTAIAVLLISFVDLAGLGGTTALLLLCVFTIVNTAVLVLRREDVGYPHYRAPTILPVLGIISCAYLATPLSGRDASQYRVAGILLLIGIALFGINYLFRRGRPAAFDPSHLTKG